MTGKIKYLLFLLLLFQVSAGYSQFDMSSVCRIEDGRIYFKLDTRWNAEQKKKVATEFGLDSAVMANAYSGKTPFTLNGTDWLTHKLSPNTIELSKSLVSGKIAKKYTEDVFLVNDEWISFTDPADRQSQPFGINKFTRHQVFNYSNGTARFFLPGYQKAEEVILAGSFNGWSTTQLMLSRSDSGWSTSIKLKPGKYSYKYIIDGSWTTDPFNYQKENDTYGDYNSIVFCFNYTFILYGSPNAKSVYLSGSFNDWEEDQLKMFRTSRGWVLPLYLREGMHAYKFIVDGEWMLDPKNPMKRVDENGHTNSWIGVGDKVTFKLYGFSSAKKVMLAGNFNNWNSNDLSMEKSASGWELLYNLGAGNYEYKFIVDGEWMLDPENKGRTGPGNYQNSIYTVKPNHTFVLDHHPNAGTVLVSGTFNNWSKEGYQMVKKEGKWVISLYLRPGKSLYKFVVDGEWILDPDNELWENNEMSTGNSIVWVKP
jgi:1,4-alpha-glucan branching enzyme